MPNGLNLSSDDHHILHHLIPQGKGFAIELSDFNSCSGCWSHILSVNLRFLTWSFLSDSASFVYCCCTTKSTLIPLVERKAFMRKRIWIFYGCEQQTTYCTECKKIDRDLHNGALMESFLFLLRSLSQRYNNLLVITIPMLGIRLYTKR